MVMHRALPRWNEAVRYEVDRIASLLVDLGNFLKPRVLKGTTPCNRNL